MVAAVSCHDAPAPRPKGSTRRIALVGNPNSGKTTIFNALTGLRQKVGNYPGITVEKRTGTLELPDGTAVEVVDLPGAYSLVSASPDEQVAAEVLRGEREGTAAPDVIVAVVDASNLARNLYLVSQLRELGRPLVVALNMMDVAERRSQRVDVAKLAKALRCEVVPVVGHRKKGLDALVRAIGRAEPSSAVEPPLPEAMREEEDRLLAPIAEASAIGPGPVARRLARRLLVADPAADLAALREAPAVARPLADALARLAAAGIDPMQAEIEAHYRAIDAIVASAVESAKGGAKRTFTERADAILIHRVFGLVIFAVIMSALFVSIFWLAKPVMDAIQAGVAWLGALVAGSMHPGPLKALVVDGIFAGVGAVVVFVPQVALLFLFLALLEDSGYLARAAFLMDRILSRVGLHGKSFIPLLSAFACAIPAILSTRTIENRRDRLATILVAPFMSCSARLPVYALLIATCFSGLSPLAQGGVLLSLYLLGIVAAMATALAVKRRLEPGRPATFILEMPTYKVPQASQVFFQAWTNTREFVTKAGTTIFALSIVLWALLYYPRLPSPPGGDLDPIARSAQIENSFAGRIGHALEPGLRPLGFDWKMGVGLVGAFAAREVFVSTLGIAYRVGDPGDDTTNLTKAMQADRYPDQTPVWTPLAAVSLMVWFVLAMQCMSTMAVVRRETGGWRWPVAQLVFMNTLAYGASLLVYQVGGRIFGS